MSTYMLPRKNQIRPRDDAPQHAPQHYIEDSPGRIDARPGNIVYNDAGQRTHIRMHDGSFRPLTSSLGTPHNARPVPSMSQLTEARARAAFDFNQKNPHLHKDEATGHVIVHPDAEARVKAAGSKQTGYDVPTDGKGGYMDSSRPGPTAPVQHSISQQNMRESMAPNPGEDRHGRTSASPSAGGQQVAATSPDISSSDRGEWQRGQAGTTSISGASGKGSSVLPNSPSNIASTAAAGITRGIVSGGFMGGGKSPIPAAPATFDGKSRGQFLADAGKSPTTPATTQPSAVPAARLADYSKAQDWFNKQDATKSAPSSPMLTGQRPNTATPPSPFNTPPPSGTTATAAPAPATPTPAAPVGPSAQDLAAAREAAAASQRGLVGNTAKAVGDTASKVGGAVVDTTKAVAAAVPKVIDAVGNKTADLIETGVKAGAQVSKDLFGHSNETPETRKLAEMTDQSHAAHNAAAGYNDAADLARYKQEDAGRPMSTAPATYPAPASYKSPLASDMGMPAPGQRAAPSSFMNPTQQTSAQPAKKADSGDSADTGDEPEPQDNAPEESEEDPNNPKKKAMGV